MASRSSVSPAPQRPAPPPPAQDLPPLRRVASSFEPSYLAAWRLAIKDGTVAEDERTLLDTFTEDRDVLVNAAVQDLNAHFAELRSEWLSQLGGGPMTTYCLEYTCLEFEITRVDLRDCLRCPVAPHAPGGWLGCAATLAFKFFMLIIDAVLPVRHAGREDRFRYLFLVLGTAWRLPTWSAFRGAVGKWWERTATLYLTIFGFFVTHAIDQVLGCVVVYSSFSETWDAVKTGEVDGILWATTLLCVHQVAHRLIEKWDTAMLPRIPFLNIRLSSKFQCWQKEFADAGHRHAE